MTLNECVLSLSHGGMIRSRSCDQFDMTGFVSYRFAFRGRGWCVHRQEDGLPCTPYPWHVTLDELYADDWHEVNLDRNPELLEGMQQWMANLQSDENSTNSSGPIQSEKPAPEDDEYNDNLCND